MTKTTNGELEPVPEIFGKAFLIVSCASLLHSATAFKHKFLAGEFPVELSIIRKGKVERVGFSRILFSEREVSRWEFALKEGQEYLSIHQSEIYGFAVDSGIAIYLDSSDKELYTQEFDEYWVRIFIEEFAKKYRDTWSYLKLPKGESTMFAFSTGFGDGFYATYIVLDREGNNICQLLTDYGILNWRTE